MFIKDGAKVQCAMCSDTQIAAVSMGRILLDDFRNAVGSKVQRNFRSGSRKWNSVLGLTIDKEGQLQ